MAGISIYVLVLNYNGLKFNTACIESLLKQTAANVEIVFLDNGSTDGSFEECKEKFGNALQFIDNKTNLYFAAGNNVGIRHALAANADYIFILNNDTICDLDCLQKLASFMEKHPEAGGCQPLLVEMNAPDRIASAGCTISLSGRAWDTQMGENVSAFYPFAKKVPGITGGAMFLRAEALQKVGLFNESYQMYFEDVELCFRLTLAGYDLYTVADTKVRHVVAGSSSDGNAERIFFCERNAYRLVGAYFPRRLRWFSLLINLLFLAPAAVLLNLFRKKPHCSVSVMRAMGEGLKQFLFQSLHTDPVKEARITPAIATRVIIPPLRKSK